MKCIEALMNRIIDYAGLFPPAKLDMATTVGNYAEYLRSADRWMLGRLVIPVARLDEFEREAEPLLRQAAADDQGEPWQISVIAAPAGSTDLAADIQRIEAFNLKHEDDEGGLAVIDVIELKGESAADIDGALDQLSDDVFAFFELSIESDPRGLIAALVAGEAGAKVRTGGTSADAYPSPQNLARFIAACAAANVPFKATAGLHQPLRHRSNEINADEFGFLNMFIAGCLALTDELPEAALAELLQEQSIAAFKFDDDGITWRKHRLKTDSIEDVREEFAVSFGSCSFDEPRDTLRNLGLL